MNRIRPWTEDNLHLLESRLHTVEIISYLLAAFAAGFGFATALAFWG